jgi:hypothetical protein
MVIDEGPSLDDTIFVTPSELDAILVPPPDKPEFKVPQAGMTFFENDRDGHFLSVRHDAGDLFPTFVTPDDAKRYMGEIDAGYTNLDAAIQTSTTAPVDFKMGWALQMGSWKAFYASATASVGWLNTKAVFEQADRFAQQLIDWRKSFAAVGGTPPGPNPLPPGQGTGGGTTASDITKIAVVLGAAYVALLFGPTFLRSFSR